MSGRKLMKLAGAALLVVAVSPLAMAEGAAKKNVLTTNVFNLIVSTFGAEYEYINDPGMGIQGSFRYGSYKIGDYECSWPGVSAGVRFYPGKNAPTGMYWGPLLYAQFMSVTFPGTASGFNYTTMTWTYTAEETVSATFVGPMVELGYRWDWGGFAFSPSLQLGYLAGKAENESGNASLSYGGFAWGVGLNCGVTF